MRLREVTLRERKLFEGYLRQDRHELAVYSFAAMELWRPFYSIRAAAVDGCLCVFFQDRLGMFMFLAPLGQVTPAAVEKAFAQMDRVNVNCGFSRIENVEESSIEFYRNAGYCVREKPGDYLCGRSALAGLRGNAYKHKRASANHFAAHYRSRYAPYAAEYKDECLALNARWAKERKGRCSDRLYQGMLDDSGRCFSLMLEDWRSLGMTGRIVETQGCIQACSFGYALNEKTFCVLFEVADLSFKGISQYIFRELCREMSGYEHINIMDDSGLANLRRVKESYRPLRVVSNFIVTRAV